MEWELNQSREGRVGRGYFEFKSNFRCFMLTQYEYRLIDNILLNGSIRGWDNHSIVAQLDEISHHPYNKEILHSNVFR